MTFCEGAGCARFETCDRALDSYVRHRAEKAGLPIARFEDPRALRCWVAPVCDYTGTPPFAAAEWAGDEDPLCLWCAGTGHPYGEEIYGICRCP